MRTSASDSRPTGRVDRTINEMHETIDAREDQQPGKADPVPVGEARATDRSLSDDQLIGRSESTYPRIVQVHYVAGLHGEDEFRATDDRGRRWFHLRPERRIRADLMGFNYTWWLVTIALLIIAIVPWPGWGY